MIKQVEFFKDLVEYWLKDKINNQDGNWYVSLSPCYAIGTKERCVRLRIVFYYSAINRSVLVLDMPVTGLQFKWFMAWCKDEQLQRKLERAFADVFEFCGRTVVMRQSFIDKHQQMYKS